MRPCSYGNKASIQRVRDGVKWAAFTEYESIMITESMYSMRPLAARESIILPFMSNYVASIKASNRLITCILLSPTAAKTRSSRTGINTVVLKWSRRPSWTNNAFVMTSTCGMRTRLIHEHCFCNPVPNLDPILLPNLDSVFATMQGQLNKQKIIEFGTQIYKIS